MAKQYGYGLGYQGYSYSQPTAAPVVAAGFPGYGAQYPTTIGVPAAAPRQPNVGYSPYQVLQSSPATTSQAYAPTPPSGNQMSMFF